ncbi:MAG: 23S rRNA (adenine(2503)-C(2))-methyltransferase RlmN [Erysipelotrichaceae bacterium]|nr:23S rRNA (adenine(2503)-C(2))-methyltransferase RlmN [Bacillota bacterium]MDY3091811.1 23S rRNA (adenine(2503)-C(2))-methyltransferase RlmN [Erysipelotrichaceae bacterium]
MKRIYDYDLKDLEEYVVSKGYKKYKAKQIYHWLYKKRVSSFDEMTDLSKDFITELKDEFIIENLTLVTSQVSKDGTTKYLFSLTDGSLIESVLMVFDYGYSACITTQIGCNMGCTFCASGLLKKVRDLSAGEILNQIVYIQKELDKKGERLANIVVMGTGEPFDNYDNVMKALSIINDPLGIEIGARHISVSTCGVIPGIKRFSKEKVQYNLAISLHASNDELRSRLMPINNAYHLSELMSTLKEYSKENNRRLTFEYLLLDGINDTEKNADELKELLKGMNAYINLIPYNNVKEKDYHTSSEKKALMFYDMLKKRGVSVTLRQKKGDDIDAACGQLRANYSKGN